MKISPKKDIENRLIPTLQEYKKRKKEILIATVLSLGVSLTPLILSSCDNSKKTHNNLSVSSENKSLNINTSTTLSKHKNMGKKREEKEKIRKMAVFGTKGDSTHEVFTANDDDFQSPSGKIGHIDKDRIRGTLVRMGKGRRPGRLIPKLVIGEGTIEDIPCDENRNEIDLNKVEK